MILLKIYLDPKKTTKNIMNYMSMMENDIEISYEKKGCVHENRGWV